MRIAIIGAGLAGLACAIECERLGVVPDVFERDESVGMKFPFLNELCGLFSRNIEKDTIITELRKLKKTPIFYNSPANYKELSKKYDYVVVASGKDTESAEMGVWEDQGQVSTLSGIALGKFQIENLAIYFNTDYAGSGFARVSPFSTTLNWVARH